MDSKICVSIKIRRRVRKRSCRNQISPFKPPACPLPPGATNARRYRHSIPHLPIPMACRNLQTRRLPLLSPTADRAFWPHARDLKNQPFVALAKEGRLSFSDTPAEPSALLFRILSSSTVFSCKVRTRVPTRPRTARRAVRTQDTSPYLRNSPAILNLNIQHQASKIKNRVHPNRLTPYASKTLSVEIISKSSLCACATNNRSKGSRW